MVIKNQKTNPKQVLNPWTQVLALMIQVLSPMNPALSPMSQVLSLLNPVLFEKLNE